MSKRTGYIRTDLAAEDRSSLCGGDAAALASAFAEEDRGCVHVERLSLSDDSSAALLHRPKGTYVTLSFGKPWLMTDGERSEVSEVLSKELSGLLSPFLCGKDPGKVLVAGLGNRRMTADAIGPKTVEKITVTAHLRALDPELFKALGHRAVAAVTPGVLGDTGIESAGTVRAAAELLHPDAILAVDALAARGTGRLAATVQLCDSGIDPGSGVGNDRPGLNERTLGCPVIALGVPLVVDSSTLVCDALESAGVKEIPGALCRVLEDGKSFFVSIKEADAAVEALSSILAEGVDRALSLDG